MKKIILITTFAILFFAKTAECQLNPMVSMFYQNEFLGNPAMAGLEPGYRLSGALKAQWTAITGAPIMQSATLDYGSNNRRIGLGLSLYNESAGLINKKRLYTSFAYHLKLTKVNVSVDFGLSGGYTDESLVVNKVIGDLSDELIGDFNQRKPYFDGDFGIAIHAKKLTLQGAVTDLKRLFNRDIERIIIDRSRYFMALSYKFTNDDKVIQSIEPKFAVRNILNYGNIYDAGINCLTSEGRLSMCAIYHSTNSITIGVGTTYKNKLSILTCYTSNTADLQNYGNSEFELALKLSFK